MTGPLRWRRPMEPDLMLDSLDIRLDVVLVGIATNARPGTSRSSSSSRMPLVAGLCPPGRASAGHQWTFF